MKKGIDVSHHQGTVDWHRVRGDGIEFVFLKATEGRSSKDPNFQANLNGAKNAGLAVGAYHFARPSANTFEQEALHFLAVVENSDLDFVALDYEDEHVTGSKAEWAYSWLQIVEKKFDRLPYLYTYIPYWQAHGSKDPKFAKYPLWVAAYRPTAPTLPAPWKEWAIWQYTSNGSVSGIGGRVDLNEAKNLQEGIFDLLTPEEQQELLDKTREIHDAIYKGDTHYGVFPGMEGMARDTWKKVLGK